jgi:hypothetical protein
MLERLAGFNLESAQAVVQSSLKPFHLKEEILAVEGVSESTFVQSREWITVYSNGKVNINTAPKEVLIALGFEESLATTLLDFRRGFDHQPATLDDGVFESTEEILPKLNSFNGLTEEQQDNLNQILGQDLLAAGSENFSVNIQTEIDSRPLMNYTIVIDKKGIKQWREQ